MAAQQGFYSLLPLKGIEMLQLNNRVLSNLPSLQMSLVAAREGGLGAFESLPIQHSTML